MQPSVSTSGISIEGDQVAGQAHVPRAKSLLRRLIERVQLGGIRVASDHVRLGDDAYCYGVVAGGVARAVIVVSPAAEEPPEQEPGVYVLVPDFVSGATIDGRITEPPRQRPYLNSFWPTAACAAFHGIELGPSDRLAVEPYEAFATPDALGPPENYSGPKWSQYVKCKPTLYSGRMRWVVQLLLGFGRQFGKSIYDRTPPKLGTARERRRNQVAPTKYQQEIKRDGVQIRFDWRWYRTHGIAVGSDDALWVVEIGSPRGAIAMPLPLHAITQTPAFREKLEKMGDVAGIEALDKLGGFPTGEGMPAGDIEPWIRAGRVVRLAEVDELDEFYDQQTFSSQMGWAWNERGDEARNLAWKYGPDGFVSVLHAGFSTTIGALAEIEPAPSAEALKRRIREKSSDQNYAANVYKCDRLPQSEVESILRAGTEGDVYAALDAATAPVPAVASGHLWTAAKGKLYKPGRLAQYELKYPWPELGYLVSFDMRQQFGDGSRAPRCDTDVHVFFVGDELKFVRFFRDPRSAPAPPAADDSDGCELIGVFTRTEASGSIGIPPMVYSSDFDDRRELTGGRSKRVTVGVDLGYAAVTVADSLIFPPNGHLSRSKRFMRTITTDAWSGEAMNSAMVAPFNDRCAYYYAVGQQFESHTHTVDYGYAQLGDPWSCDTWRNFPGFTGTVIGGNYIRAEHPDGCGPVDERTVRAPGAYYDNDAGPCADFADSGPWCFQCDNADSMTYAIPPPPLPPSEGTFQPRTSVRTAWLLNANGLTPFITETATFTGSFNGYAAPWFTMSPDPESFITQFAEVTHNAFGDGDAIRYSTAPNASPEVRGAPQPPGFDTANSTFVGVVP